MKSIIEFLDSKQFKKLKKNRDFVFCISAYPAILFVYIFIKIYISNADLEDTAVWYTFASFILLGSFAVISIFERVEKRVTYKVQGDKLKLKRAENKWKS